MAGIPADPDGTPALSEPLGRFLAPLRVDVDAMHRLSERFLDTFTRLAAESTDQFLPTPISDAILRPVGRRGSGRYLSMDIGGSNLRVGFVELLGRTTPGAARTHRHLEQSWPIDDRLKSDNADRLFRWIGSCVAAVVRAGCDAFDLPRDRTLPLGVTFSFPMEQTSLAEARLMSMGKGFAVSADLDLGSRLLAGYDLARADTDSPLPPLRVAAIANDSVSTLVSFIVGYDDAAGAEHDVDGQHQRACMGLILGTGCNATIPLPLSRLHPSKRPPSVSVLPGEAASSRVADLAVAVNTEWSINGTAPPLRELGLVTRWDRLLDERGEAPGFQPLEYMTAGRYLGELGRLMLVDYLVDVVGVDPASLPARLRDTRHAVSTTFLSHFRPPADLQEALRREFSLMDTADAAWCPDAAAALYHIAKAIEVRAAGIVAAATVALLVLGGELPASDEDDVPGHVLGVGYTGGCIVHFQDYLVDCQAFIDELVARRYAARARRGEALPRVVLSPCHDGGIVGAGILVAAAMGSERAVV